MEDLLNEIINEANKGNIIIDGGSFPIAFNSIIYENEQKNSDFITNENYPTLIIKNKKELIEKLKEYVNIALTKINKFPTFSKNEEYNRVKILIAYLFVNSTTEDFLNPIKMIDRNIAFLNDNTFDYLNNETIIPLKSSFESSNLIIKNAYQSVFMELN